MKISMKNRKIGYTYSSVSGYYSFRKEKSIAFESTLERDLLVTLEFNDSVCDVVEQPVTLLYENSNGKTVSYTPDFLVYFKQPNENVNITKLTRKPLLIEVKPNKILQKKFPELKQKFKIGMKYALENDMIFKIYDEFKIRNDYYEKIKFLNRYKNLQYDEHTIDTVINYIHNVESTTIDTLLEYNFLTKTEKGMGLGCIWHLIATKKVLCFFDKPLNLQTEVWLNNKYYKDDYEN